MIKLFQDIAEFKKFLNVSLAFKTYSLETKVDFTLEKYILHWIGQDQWDYLVAVHADQSTTPLLAKDEALIKKIQLPLANFLFLEHIPWAQVNITDAGITRTETDSIKTAYANQVNQLINSTSTTGYDSLEMMIKFLEDNEDDYPLWKASTSYTNSRQRLINSSLDFAKLYPLLRGRQTFRTLLPLMDDVELFNIVPLLGHSFYDELKLKILNKDTFSAYESKLLMYLNKATANFTISKAIIEQWVKYTSTGVQAFTHSEQSAIQVESSAPTTITSAKAESLLQTAKKFIDQAQCYLEDNIDQFETFKNDVSVNPVDDDDLDEIEAPIFYV